MNSCLSFLGEGNAGSEGQRLAGLWPSVPLSEEEKAECAEEAWEGFIG